MTAHRCSWKDCSLAGHGIPGVMLWLCTRHERRLRALLVDRETTREARRLAVAEAGWTNPPEIDTRRLRYGAGTEVSGGLPSLGKDAR